jgi:hypothetical protein
MTDILGWRRAYNAVERNVSPRVETLVHSDEFAQMSALIARTRRLAGTRVNAMAASVCRPLGWICQIPTSPVR